jgi:hypothetical protein
MIHFYGILFPWREGYALPKVKYHVRLSESERKTLLKMVSKGSASAKSIMHANVLLAAD